MIDTVADLLDYRYRPLAHGAAGTAAAAKATADHAASQVEALQQKVDRLTLLNLALTELIQRRLGVSEADIIGLVEEIDLRDGRLDGRLDSKRAPEACAACGRKFHVRHDQCLYCGARRDRSSLDRLLP
jgi:hypothetical protein